MLLVGTVLLDKLNMRLLLLLLLRVVWPLLLIWWNLLQVWLVTRLKIDRLKLVVPVINIEAIEFMRQGIC
jgi:hypothetical protein